MSSLTPSSIQWGGLTFWGHQGAGRFTFATLEGWEGLPASRVSLPPRQGHGSFDGQVTSAERWVRVSGECRTRAERDALLAELGAVFVFAEDTAPLTIAHGGRTLTADARLTRYAPTPRVWGEGFFGWAAEWVCPDPLRYGTPVSTSTPFPTLRGGLEFDLYTDAVTDTGFLEYGLASDTGRLIVTNVGTADAPVTFQVEGPVDVSGFEIAQVDSDRRLRFTGPVGATSTLVLDGGTGNVLIDGTSDRGGLLTYRDWPTIPPGASVEFAFIPLGVTSSARLTAVIRPGSW